LKEKGREKRGSLPRSVTTKGRRGRFQKLNIAEPEKKGEEKRWHRPNPICVPHRTDELKKEREGGTGKKKRAKVLEFGKE